MLVVGIERVDYTSRKTGKRVLGYRVYGLSEQKNVVGQMAEEAFLSDDVGTDLVSDAGGMEGLIGRQIYLNYNRYGSIISAGLER